MKHYVLVCLLLLLAASGYGLAQTYAMHIKVVHGDGSVTIYSNTDSTAAAACGDSFQQAWTNIQSGDVIELPAVQNCNLTFVEDVSFPDGDFKVVGMGPDLTSITAIEIDEHSGSAVFEGMTLNVAGCPDNDECMAPFYLQADDGTNPWGSVGQLTLRNVNIVSGGGPVVWADGQDNPTTTNILLDHVNITNPGPALWMLNTGTAEIRNSTLTDTGASVLQAIYGTTINVYDSILQETTGSNTLISMEYVWGGTINAYAGTSLIAPTGVPVWNGCSSNNSSGMGQLNLYPGSYVSSHLVTTGNCHLIHRMPSQ
jgi:hypothetical protein